MSCCAACCLVNCCNWTSSGFTCCAEDCVTRPCDISNVAMAVLLEEARGFVTPERRQYGIFLLEKSLASSSGDDAKLKIIDEFVNRFFDTPPVYAVLSSKLGELAERGHEDSKILFCKVYFRSLKKMHFSSPQASVVFENEFDRAVKFLNSINKEDPEIAQLKTTFFSGYPCSAYVDEQYRIDQDRRDKTIAIQMENERKEYAEQQLLKSKPELAMMKRLEEERVAALDRQTAAIAQHTSAIESATGALNEATNAVNNAVNW